MSRRAVPASARLVVSAVYGDERILEAAFPRISEILGEARFIGRVFPFDHTDHYSAEMGAPLFRRFLEASASIPRDALPDVKIGLERIEQELSEGGRRRVNLDPGLVTPENFILATGKNFTHRVYLRNGVFADLTLIFRKGEYRALAWTYPDYASPEIRGLLQGVRSELLASRAAGGARKCG